MTDASPLDRFRAAAMTDSAIQQSLAGIRDPEAFEALAVEWANARGIPLTAADLTAASKPDPLGIHGFAPPPQSGAAWPPQGWLPARCAMDCRAAASASAGCPRDSRMSARLLSASGKAGRKAMARR